LSVAAAKCAYESTDGLATAEGVKQVITGLQVVAGIVSRFDALGVMHAHAHMGVVGFFVLLIVGVSYRLIPMFLLTEVQSKQRAWWSVILLNVGLAGAVMAILLRSVWKPAFAVILVAGLAVYGWEMAAMVRARKRRAVDWGLKTFLVAMVLLVPVCILALVLSWPTLPMTQFFSLLENVYGVVGILGVVGLAIIGMLYKILPFLVWYGVYSPLVGRAQLPTTAQMVSERLQAGGLALYLAGLGICAVAIMSESETWVRGGAFVMAASLMLFGGNAIKVLAHFWRPQIKPFAGAKTVLS
jgi:hypothetical protein